MKSFIAIALWAMTIINSAIHEATAAIPTTYTVLRYWSPQRELHNFKGRPLRIFYFENPGFFEFYDNDTKAMGICGDIWTALSQLLNFTLVLTKFERNVSEHSPDSRGFDTVLLNVLHNKADIIPKMTIGPIYVPISYTPVLWTNRQRIFARAYWTVNRDWMFYVFSIEVWTLVITFTLTLGIASIATQKILSSNKVLELRDRSYVAHLFYTFASICNQGNASDNAKSGSKMLTFTVSVFSWLILAAYSSCLIHNMTQNVVDAPYNNRETLLKNTNLQILVLAGSLSHLLLFSPKADEISRRVVKAKRVSVEMNIEELYRKVCLHPDKYVLWDEEDAVATRNITADCRLFPVDIPSTPMLISSAVRSRLRNRRSLDIGIIKLHELGVINKILNRYMPPDIDESAMKQTTLFIDMHRVSIIFGILAIGIFASIVICVIENIVYSLNLWN